jgi:hypothetical protein
MSYLHARPFDMFAGGGGALASAGDPACARFLLLGPDGAPTECGLLLRPGAADLHGLYFGPEVFDVDSDDLLELAEGMLAYGLGAMATPGTPEQAAGALAARAVPAVGSRIGGAAARLQALVCGDGSPCIAVFNAFILLLGMWAAASGAPVAASTLRALRTGATAAIGHLSWLEQNMKLACRFPYASAMLSLITGVDACASATAAWQTARRHALWVGVQIVMMLLDLAGLKVNIKVGDLHLHSGMTSLSYYVRNAVAPLLCVAASMTKQGRRKLCLTIDQACARK